MTTYSSQTSETGAPPRADARGTLQALASLVSLVRMHHWIKNVFVMAPLFFSPGVMSGANALKVCAGALCFCAVASCVYVVNDIADRASDRSHPKKRRRPLAAGTVTVFEAWLLTALLATSGLAAAVALSPPFATVLAIYLVLNLGYSFGLKHVSILDIFIVAAGFVLRVDAGARLIAVEPSVWIILCTGFLALFLTIGKRRDDLVKDVGDGHRPSLKGYTKQYLDIAATMVLGALLVSYAIYTTDAGVIARLGSDRLYLTVPFVLAGILRYLQIILVEERSGSPTRIVVSDRFMILTIVGWIATVAVLIYR
ncbi:MAG: decaprenyl-phosphate phosphoribosyltransferase [Alphaproteobacteria bacterium]